MSSSEEYLDNLLKSLTEGTGSANAEPLSTTPDLAGASPAGSLQEMPLSDNAAPEETDGVMNMDDIEAMFTSMGMGTTDEEPSTDEAASIDDIMTDELSLDEGMLSEEMPMDELSLGEGMLSEEMPMDELSLGEGMLSEEMPMDELSLDEGMLSEEMLMDELTLDEGMLSEEMPMDELSLDEGMLSEEMSMDELSLDEGMLSEEMPMDELSLDEGMLSEEMPMDGLSLDEGMLSEEMPMDELSLDEGMLSEEMPMDELSLDEGMLSEEMPMDELSLDEGMLSEEMSMDELSLDEGMLSEEMPMDGLSFDDGLLADEDSASDDLNLDELGLGDLGLDELGSEETDIADTDMMIQEESDIESEPGDDFALEESGEDDADLSALLASMGGDEALAEINDLLEKSDQGVTVDDDMLALLGNTHEGAEGEESFDIFAGGGSETEEGESDNIREITPEELSERGDPKAKKQKKKEEKERKKREKAAKLAKKNNASQSADAEYSDVLGENPESMDFEDGKPKKQGFFAKFLDLLLEEDESENTGIDGDAGDVGLVIGNLTDENKELLDELSAEDKKNAKKKDKKAKKAKKDKKKDDAAAEEGEEGGEEVEEKPKKQKKVKKPKKEKEVEEEPRTPEKRLSKKKVVSIFLFCATIAACIVIVTMLLPQQMEKQEARVAFDNNQYTQVYDLLYGKKLSEEDEVLLYKSSLVLQMQRKLDSYENYVKMEMPLEALNALVEGVDRYRNLRDDAELYNVGGEIASIYGQILARLSDNYGISESDALDIISSGDDVTYSQRLQSIISGEIYGEGEETQPMEKQDVLPEEEEIIDRLQGTETE